MSESHDILTLYSIQKVIKLTLNIVIFSVQEVAPENP
jgi:hypothetical protein